MMVKKVKFMGVHINVYNNREENLCQILKMYRQNAIKYRDSNFYIKFFICRLEGLVSALYYLDMIDDNDFEILGKKVFNFKKKLMLIDAD